MLFSVAELVAKFQKRLGSAPKPVIYTSHPPTPKIRKYPTPQATPKNFGMFQRCRK